MKYYYPKPQKFIFEYPPKGRTFVEIFPSSADFVTFYNNCGFPAGLASTEPCAKFDIDLIYTLLLSSYANMHIIANGNENQFKLKVMTIIYEAGPTWQRAMEVQDKLLTITDAEVGGSDPKRLSELLVCLDDMVCSRFIMRFKRLFYDEESTKKKYIDTYRQYIYELRMHNVEKEFRKNIKNLDDKTDKEIKKYADDVCLKCFGCLDDKQRCRELLKAILS